MRIDDMNINTQPSSWTRPFRYVTLRFQLWLARFKLRQVNDEIIKTHEETDDAFGDSDFETVTVLHRHWVSLSQEKTNLERHVMKLVQQLRIL